MIRVTFRRQNIAVIKMTFLGVASHIFDSLNHTIHILIYHY
jgi:hypothetical protein